ncbi:MAG TPA: hypothetical protein VFD35_12105 [Pricia sp.]|nr:hypothetical protein [Pricia sp.]
MDISALTGNLDLAWKKDPVRFGSGARWRPVTATLPLGLLDIIANDQ